ncbi:HAMP domain-containing histidine kinase [Candidatus Saccharibacteria bacterium]|jgi:signal transduction histidine kinase|nr:HAMP domain-containing histidine kinase [Candidatus Saccharibacteria bacterium]
MNISKQFKLVSRRFIIIIVALSVLSVGLLSFTLYETNSIRFRDGISPNELQEVIKDDEAVVKYLQSEKNFEAHFVTIASLVKQDQQKLLGKALLLTTVPVILIVTILSYFVARYLLKPVRQSYESQERFLQDAAHELRNPLAAMSLAIENADKTGADQNLVKTMRRQTKRLIRINEDLLYLERRTPGEIINEVNISELLEDVLEDMQALIINKKLKLEKKIQTDIIIKIDPKDFIKMSRNIIENAIKYSKIGKKLTVNLHQNKRIVLLVEDQGIGIPTQDIEHIGERFYRSKNVGNVDGTGLGIAIVKKVLNLYGSDLSIASKVDQGTTVKITF